MAKKKYTLNTAKKRLAAAKLTASEIPTKDIRREFIDKFTLCDLVCKAVLETYEKAKGTYKPGSYLVLSMRSIPSAMNFLGLSIPQHILGGIFGGTGIYKKRNSKSAKKLRDGIVHGMNKEDVNEVVTRNADLNNLMDTFLSFFSYLTVCCRNTFAMIFDAPLEVQEQFAFSVKQVDKSKVAVQKALDEAQLLFGSLM